MLRRPWIFLSNPFLVATRTSYEKAVTLSTYTDSRLASSPGMATLYAFYHPLHIALLTAYNAWKLAGGQQKTSTSTVGQLLDSLTEKVNDWDFAIQSIARKGTPAYLTFFPQGHTPFLQGKQDMRIAAVGTLSEALETVTPAPAVKADVDAFHASVTAANAQQEGRKGGTDTMSLGVEGERIAVCHGLYYVLGSLMSMNYMEPEFVGTFFDLELLRKRTQDDFTGSVAAGAVKTIVKRTLDADDLIVLKNDSLVPLTFYLALVKDEPLTSSHVSVTVPEGLHQTVPASALGDVATMKFLTVFNPSTLTDGNWEVEI